MGDDEAAAHDGDTERAQQRRAGEAKRVEDELRLRPRCGLGGNNAPSARRSPRGRA